MSSRIPKSLPALLCLLLATIAGCGQKVPTFGELVGAKKEEPSGPVNVAPPPVTAPPVEVKPAANPAEIIAGFYQTPVHEIGEGSLQMLASLPNGKEAVRELKLPGSKVTDAGLKALPDLPALASLDLSGTQITDEGLAPLANCPALETLTLSGTKISGRGLSEVAKNPNIKALIVDGCSFDASAFAAIGAMSQLEQVSFSQTIVPVDGCKFLSGLKNLRKINFHLAGVNDQGLAFFTGLKELQVLQLSECPVNGQGLLAMVKGDSTDKLETLVLYACPLGPRAGDAVKTMKTLRELNIAKTPLVDADLAVVRPLVNLRIIKLGDSGGINGEGFAFFKGMKELEEVHAGNVPGLGDKALVHLKGLKNLKVLQFTNTAVTQNAAQQFMKLHPGCEVIWGR
jgi:internalin A